MRNKYINNKYINIEKFAPFFVLLFLTFDVYGGDQMILSTLDHRYSLAPLEGSVELRKVNAKVGLLSNSNSLDSPIININNNQDLWVCEARLGIPSDAEFYVVGAFGTSTKTVETTSREVEAGRNKYSTTASKYVHQGPTDPSVGLRKRFKRFRSEGSQSGILLEGGYSPSLGKAYSASKVNNGSNYRGGYLWALGISGYQEFGIWDLKLSAQYAESGASTKTEAGTPDKTESTSSFSSYSYGILNRWAVFKAITLDLGLSFENAGPSTVITKSPDTLSKESLSSLSLRTLNLGLYWDISQRFQLSFGYLTVTSSDDLSLTSDGKSLSFSPSGSRLTLALQMCF